MYRGRALRQQLPSTRSTCPRDPTDSRNDVDEAEERDARKRYAEGWAEAHYEDNEAEDRP